MSALFGTRLPYDHRKAPNVAMKSARWPRAVEVFKEDGIKVRELNAQKAALQATSADLQYR